MRLQLKKQILCLKFAAINGAGAVVTKDVDAFSIMVGNPAKKIGEIDENCYTYFYICSLLEVAILFIRYV